MRFNFFREVEIMFQRITFFSFFERIWTDLKSMGFVAPAIIVVCVAAVLVFAKTAGKKRNGSNIRFLTYGAICVSLAYVLSFIKIVELPFGGSVTAASMLPILAYGYMAGPFYGTLAGLVYFLLQLTQPIYVLSPLQFVFDYVLPFTVLGTLSGCIKTKHPNLNLYSGFTLAVFARYVCHVLAGYLFWRDTFPADTNPLVYTCVYNAFVFIDALPCFILISVPKIKRLFKPLKKQ